MFFVQLRIAVAIEDRDDPVELPGVEATIPVPPPNRLLKNHP
jgi:hypothetical protein